MHVTMYLHNDRIYSFNTERSCDVYCLNSTSASASNSGNESAGGGAVNRGAYVLVKTHDFPSALASSGLSFSNATSNSTSTSKFAATMNTTSTSHSSGNAKYRDNGTVKDVKDNTKTNTDGASATSTLSSMRNKVYSAGEEGFVMMYTFR